MDLVQSISISLSNISSDIQDYHRVLVQQDLCIKASSSMEALSDVPSNIRSELAKALSYFQGDRGEESYQVKIRTYTLQSDIGASLNRHTGRAINFYRLHSILLIRSSSDRDTIILSHCLEPTCLAD